MIFKDNPDTFQQYLRDASNHPGNAGEIYIPENRQELSDTLSCLYENNTFITFQGARTSTTGAASPHQDAVISTEKMNQILEYDESKATLTVQPGVTLADIEDFLQDKPLFYPCNPTEKDATIGGNVATNASGSRTFKYGATIDNIESVKLIHFENHKLNEIIYPIAKKYNCNTMKSAVGYNTAFFGCGSEGTLGAISEITLKLLPKPENVFGLIIFFNENDEIPGIVEKCRVNLLQEERRHLPSPRLIEYFDKPALKIISKDFPGIPENANACLWIEQEYAAGEDEEYLEKWFELIGNSSSLPDDTIAAFDESKHREFAEMRHAIPLYVNDKTSRLGVVKKATDTSVPHANFREHFDFMNEVMKNSGLEYISFGHIGNSHIHTNFLPTNEAEISKADELNEQIIRNAIRLNGSVSAEHGIGKIKKKYMQMMLSEHEMTEMKKLKAKLDPQNLFGKGNLF
jgi:D-lactate dehydrogenase (cytochrome)